MCNSIKNQKSKIFTKPVHSPIYIKESKKERDRVYLRVLNTIIIAEAELFVCRKPTEEKFCVCVVVPSKDRKWFFFISKQRYAMIIFSNCLAHYYYNEEKEQPFSVFGFSSIQVQKCCLTQRKFVFWCSIAAWKTVLTKEKHFFFTLFRKASRL